MSKKTGVLLYLFFIVIFGFMIFFKIKMGVRNGLSNVEDDNDGKIFGEQEDIHLYATDFKNDNGYKYTEIELTNEKKIIIGYIMKELSVNQSNDETTFGSYKLEYGNYVLFFDLDNDSALYKNDNIIIYFSKKDKEKIIDTQNRCSCCKDDKCSIDFCHC